MSENLTTAERIVVDLAEHHGYNTSAGDCDFCGESLPQHDDDCAYQAAVHYAQHLAQQEERFRQLALKGAVR